MAQELVTESELGNRLWAHVQHIDAVTGSSAITERLVSDSLSEAKDSLQEDLETVWEKQVIVASRTAVNAEWQEVPYDYRPGMYRQGNLPLWTLRRRPVFSIEKVNFALGPSLGILTAPVEWYRPNLKRGTVALVPIGHTAAIAGVAGAWYLPWFENMQPARDIPQFAAIDYTAGWYDPDGTTMPPDTGEIRRGIYAQASLNFMRQPIVTRLIPQSVSSPDATQSFMSLNDEIKLAEETVEKFKQWWGKHYRPPRMVMI